MIYGTGKFKIHETNVGSFEIQKKTIGGWSPMVHEGKILDFPTHGEASTVLDKIEKEW